MVGHEENRFSSAVTVFHERPLPQKGTPAGYAALIDRYALAAPWPRTLSATGERHQTSERQGWRMLTPRHAPAADLEGHLRFALKYEGVDLAVLNRLFQATGPDPIVSFVRAKPTGSYARRIWFLYEWLTATRLDLPDASAGTYVGAIDAGRQYAVAGENSPRHRVRNNLPGTRAFCPLVFRTATLEKFGAMDLAERAQAAVANLPRDLLSRAAAFLLLKDSKSSYAIEGERAPQDRIQRWGRAIGEAGRHPIDLDELLRLQRIVIGDARFVKLGLRDQGGFVGEHDRDSGMPLPEHISARAGDLPSLIEGMVAFDRSAARDLDPVVAAAVLGFGFVYVHPFEDGNGRIHRYLIHHILARRGFSPAGVVFPVSSAILHRIDEYRDVLEDTSSRLLPLIRWEATRDGNVRVPNDTADYYRYFDATPHAEFLYSCVQATIETDLPHETDFLRRYDHFRERVQAVVDMPDRTVDLLLRFLRQNGGRLSARARESEFTRLTDAETASVEDAFADNFAGG